jgi:monoamine oxidase
VIDAVVVGAGLSGLVCATRLARAGASVRVIEARDRIGGRLHTGRIAGVPIDLGGQWMSVGQPRLAALVRELEIATVPHHRAGKRLVDTGDGGWIAQLRAAFAQWRSARRIATLAAAPPAETDAISLATWLAREVHHPTAHALLAMHAELVFAADPADLSLLHYLTVLDATGGFGPTGPDLPGGAREHRISGGAQSLARALADRLADAPKAAIELATPVTAIADVGDHVELRTATTTASVIARRVVLALPPSLVRRIDVALAPSQRQMTEASQLGRVVKCFVAYERPFWRDAGLSGEAYLPRGTVRATVGLELSEREPAILLAFIVGRAADAWAARTPALRRAEVIDTVVAQFGAHAATPLDYLEVDWGVDPWSAGCVAGLPPGVLGAGAAWREPHGRIHVAGTESAIAWPGYMEGAIEAGERAADEVLRADP